MQKNIIKKQAEEKLQQLKDLLLTTDILAPATHEEVKEIQKRLQEAERIITVYEYLLAQNEIAHDFNVHLKVMQESEKLQNKAEEKKVVKEILESEIKEQKKETELKKETVLSETPVENPKSETNELVTSNNNNNKPQTTNLKRLEFTINDKYRIINELFHQSQQEFNIAVAQLNSEGTWEDAKIYLDSLVALYSWNPEKEIVKTFYRITQKKFS